MFDSFLEYYNDFSAIFIVLGSALEGENSLLLLSGVSYTLGHSYWYVVGLAVIGGILGESIGYTLGKYNKERIYSIPVLSHIVTEKRVKVMEHFYQNHGGKTLVIIRFIYGLRTAGAIMAGMSGMRTTKFYIYNIFWAILWANINVSLVYFLADTIDIFTLIPLLMLFLFVLGFILRKKFL